MPDTYSAQALLDDKDVFAKLTPPAKLGVFGDPVAHSKSPYFHNAALKASGQDLQYVRLHADAEIFPQAVKALPEAGFIGANVTIPHKQAALKAVDEADDYAKQSGAVNTIVVQDGSLYGFNTDGPGLVRAIREEFFVDLRDARVLLLGAGGGAGRAIAVQCALEGCERLVLANRTFEKATAMASELGQYFRSDRLIGPADRCVAVPQTPEGLRTEIGQVDLVINASSVGMKRTDPSPLPASLLTANLLVFDTVYSGGKSRLVEDAEAAGARACNGLPMLLHQGALSFEIWFNRKAPLDVMRKALLESVA